MQDNELLPDPPQSPTAQSTKSVCRMELRTGRVKRTQPNKKHHNSISKNTDHSRPPNPI